MAEPIPAPPPEVPVTVVPALLTLTKLSALFFVLGIIAAARAFIDTMLGFIGQVVGNIPIIGGIFSAATGRLAQLISNKMGSWIIDLDPTYGGFFLALSTITGDLASDHLESAYFDFIHAKKFRGINDPRTINQRVTKTINKASAAVAASHAAVAANARTQHAAVAQAKVVARTATVGLAGELDHVIEWDIPRLRARTKKVEDGLAKAWNWIRARPLAIPAAVAASAVAVALTSLGASWIRCRNWKRIGKSVCGLPFALIEELLSAAIDVLLIADVCQITKLMIRTAESTVVQDALRGIVTGIDELMLCQGVDLPKPLDGYTAGLPPAQTFSALPAA